MHVASAGESVDPLAMMKATLVARGYQEAITYSFIEPALDRLLGRRGLPATCVE